MLFLKRYSRMDSTSVSIQEWLLKLSLNERELIESVLETDPAVANEIMLNIKRKQSAVTAEDWRSILSDEYLMLKAYAERNPGCD